MNIPKVFIVEDDAIQAQMFINALAGKADVITAYNLDRAFKTFDREEGITLIACDACLKGGSPDTLNLIMLMRSKFAGPIVAISSTDKFNDQLLKAGCSHKVLKPQASRLILELIGQDLVYPLVPILDGLPLSQAFMENSLELLHSLLTPDGIPKAGKILDKLTVIVAGLGRADLLPALEKTWGDIDGLKQFSDCLSYEYIALLLGIRDTLLPLAEELQSS